MVVGIVEQVQTVMFIGLLQSISCKKLLHDGMDQTEPILLTWINFNLSMDK